ncbi:MFS family permease [Polymorphobacter multimanifer]|uniref:MFS family permease n=1 Tax=Polymorphobacter multimanifer TaxID=1070431 RepID=A0A841LAC7_9SPHN|nr:MFS transporter [Polymorphobacter multimanifer]MBB6227913.1 MFS family permease [Polymorphobacter multimanifer]
MSDPDGDWPSPAIAWGSVAALLLAYIVSFADRQILSLLVGPIKADLQISDTQFSLLAGLAFAIFYTVMGLPFGRLADRASRRLIVVVGTLAGGMAAAACGLANSFAALFGGRVFAGTADAALGPSVFSMLADLFPPASRARAFSVYSLGIYFGAGLAFGAGGLVVGAVAENPQVTLPLIGTVQAWQAVFLVIAAPAFLLAPFLLLLPEPVRRGRAETPEQLRVRETLRYVWTRRALFGPWFFGFGIVVLANFATLAWTPEFFIRRHGVSPRDAGVQIGLIMAVAGSVGVLAGGWFADWLASRGRRDGTLIAGALACLGGMVPGVMFPLVDDPALAKALLAPLFFFGAFASGAAPSAIGAVVPNEMRGQVSALYLLVINLLGIGLGPTLPALFTDFLFGDEAKLGLSLALTAAITGLPSAWLLHRARKPYLAASQR